jgi:hypothetical protein
MMEEAAQIGEAIGIPATVSIEGNVRQSPGARGR